MTLPCDPLAKAALGIPSFLVFRLALAQPDGSFAARLWLMLPLHIQGPCSLLDLVGVLGDHTVALFRGVFHQLMWVLGTRLSALMLKAAKCGKQCHGLEMDKVEIADVLHCRADMDNVLYRYVMSCKSKTVNKQNWTCCSDKSSVGGFALQATLFAFSNNVAVVAPPAVPMDRRVVYAVIVSCRGRAWG
jgi:hypothetical protein